jgi:hypothetical protein
MHTFTGRRQRGREGVKRIERGRGIKRERAINRKRGSACETGRE